MGVKGLYGDPHDIGVPLYLVCENGRFIGRTGESTFPK